MPRLPTLLAPIYAAAVLAGAAWRATWWHPWRVAGYALVAVTVVALAAWAACRLLSAAGRAPKLPCSRCGRMRRRGVCVDGAFYCRRCVAWLRDWEGAEL